jgi:hypothetical protein
MAAKASAAASFLLASSSAAAATRPWFLDACAHIDLMAQRRCAGVRVLKSALQRVRRRRGAQKRASCVMQQYQPKFLSQRACAHDAWRLHRNALTSPACKPSGRQARCPRLGIACPPAPACPRCRLWPQRCACCATKKARHPAGAAPAPRHAARRPAAPQHGRAALQCCRYASLAFQQRSGFSIFESSHIFCCALTSWQRPRRRRAWPWRPRSWRLPPRHGCRTPPACR